MSLANKDTPPTGPTLLEEPDEADAGGKVSRSVRWDPEDLRLAAEAARVLSAREGLNLTAADVIRRGARKEFAAILGAA